MSAFLSAIGQTASQGAAQSALQGASNGLLSQFQSLANPALTQGLSQGLLSQLSNMGSKGFDFLTSEQGINALGTGVNAFKGISDMQQAKKLSNIYDKQFAMTQEAYNRDKEADNKRQLLNF